MSPTLEDLKHAAADLPAGDRAELAEYLLRSLDDHDERGVRTEWLAVAEQRMAEVRAGTVSGIPAEEVLKQLLEPRR